MSRNINLGFVKMIFGIIYRATNLVNGKMYIGQTIKKLETRIRQHYANSQKRDCKFASALVKYKPEDWKWEVLIENIPIEQLGLFEKSYIWGLSTFRFGYNSTTGGANGVPCEETRKKIVIALTGKPCKEETKKKISKSLMGHEVSEETRKKMSLKSLGREKSEEERKKLSIANSGKPSPKKGIPLSEEHKRKISENHSKHMLGKHPSEETKEKISLAARGHKVSEETKKKMSLSHLGEKHPMFGKHHSEEAREKMSKSRFGRSVSEETRKRMSEASKLREATKRKLKVKQ